MEELSNIDEMQCVFDIIRVIEKIKYFQKIQSMNLPNRNKDSIS